ncbi:phage holin [Lederbergia lenta]|uniref:phage holin n=1 Tax=Lederbergia lenta TaxID=1467 RepID=UPI00204119B2|nr:phage holin [Lederbergia lenta]MCM3110058.1 phage holin [Lederbergia lenta]
MEVIQEHIIEILFSILTFVGAYVGAYAKRYLNAKFSDKQLEQGIKYANIAVHAAEQVYIEANGKEKFNKAKQNFRHMLNENKINITDEEIDALLEAMVAEMNKSFKGNNEVREVEATTIYQPVKASEYFSDFKLSTDSKSAYKIAEEIVEGIKSKSHS